MMFVLKDYQTRSLNSLKLYFSECIRSGDADIAFYTITNKFFGRGIPYNPVKDLPGLPYVCVRIPTGGGKTLVASHSIGVAARDLIQTDTSVILWLVPSNTILSQTLDALKDINHPYRQALEVFAETITVLDVEQALYLKKANLDSGLIIIVSTIQAFKVENKIGRKVYRSSGNLMDHFSGLSDGILNDLDRGKEGNLNFSLANILRIRRPIVIVDEAHNARTVLTFETLARFKPSCIIEFTATPDLEKNPSNVLHTVSAAELKSEEMIKMPIILETCPDWKKLLSDAISCRNKLEEISRIEWQQTGEYIRPIMLIQAQPHSKSKETISVEEVEKTLQSDFLIAREHIAIATGTKNELDKIDDISDKSCPVRYVITMQALREGWDCANAYVLCSIAEMKSSVYVEQILGRIMRLPKAKWKQNQELNKAYAFVASYNFFNAANSLTDALIQNGFERQEARELIVKSKQYEAELPLFDYQLSKGSITLNVPESPSLSLISSELQKRIIYDEKKDALSIKGVLTLRERDELMSAFTSEKAKEIVNKAYRLTNELPEEYKSTFSECNIEFKVPVLSLKQGDLFEQFEETHFLDFSWDLSSCDASLTEEEYAYKKSEAEHGEITVTESGKISTQFLSSLHSQMMILSAVSDWKASDLVYWLDRKIKHPDIDDNQSSIFLSCLVKYLVDHRNIPLEHLVNDKFYLLRAAEKKINEHREAAYNLSYQLLLDPDCKTPLVVDPDSCFQYDPKQYPFGRLYKGSFSFHKHYYPLIDNMNDEEVECAQYIDSMNEVKFWVRNIERRPNHSFWLQTSTDKFYPDFVAKLNDGRILVVEYKGEHLWSNEDSTEKRNIGELWAKRSNGMCLFTMPKGKNWSEIDNIIKKVG